MAVYRFLRFISLLAVSTALRKSVKSRQKSTKGRRTDAQLTADLKAKGVCLLSSSPIVYTVIADSYYYTRTVACASAVRNGLPLCGSSYFNSNSP